MPMEAKIPLKPKRQTDRIRQHFANHPSVTHPDLNQEMEKGEKGTRPPPREQDLRDESFAVEAFVGLLTGAIVLLRGARGHRDG